MEQLSNRRVGFFKTATNEFLTAGIPVVANLPPQSAFKPLGSDLWRSEACSRAW